MSNQSLYRRGKKRQLCSCPRCDSNSAPDLEASSSRQNDPQGDQSESECDLVFPPTKRKRLEDPPSAKNILDKLFDFNNRECEPFELDQADDISYEIKQCDAKSETSGDKEDVSEEGEEDSSEEDESKERKSTENRQSNYGSNMYNGNEKCERKGLRPIVIDGSNVAMGHTNGRYFSCKGLKICVDYFLERKHKVYVIVPHFRQCQGQARDQHILRDLYQRGHLYFTPSRMVDGRLEVPYDDRYIVQLAAATGGVIVSSDRYRDLLKEDPRWAETIKDRLLMFTWIDDILFFPKDPFGKRGPSLDELLRF